MVLCWQLIIIVLTYKLRSVSASGWHLPHAGKSRRNSNEKPKPPTRMWCLNYMLVLALIFFRTLAFVEKASFVRWNDIVTYFRSI